MYVAKRNRNGGILRDERATVAIEFAMVTIPFLIMLFGIIAFGFYFAGRIALSYVLAEGGRACVSALSAAECTSVGEAAMNDALERYKSSGLIKEATPKIIQREDGKIIVSISQASVNLPALPSSIVPDLSTLPPVSTTFIITDPSS